tara:strand:- start:2345 stop:3448 length:1104 start_codon:yes stop_codon:yes gene_type:complete
MSWKGFLDFGDIIMQPFEAFAETLRNAFGYDSYAGKRTFHAVVLTPPMPIVASQAGLFTGANRPTTPIEGEEQYAGPDAALNKLDKFFFRARIIGPNSPHEFLPDPCLLANDDTTPPDAYFKLCAMHTLFVSSDDFQIGTGAVIPQKGHIVLVELEENQFGFNLDRGRFITVTSKTNPYYNVENMLTSQCTDPTGGLDFSLNLGNMLLPPPQEIVYNGTAGSDVKFTNGSPPVDIVTSVNTQYSSAGVKLLKDAAVDYDKMAKAFSEHFKKPMGITDGLRTYQGQIKAKQKWASRGQPGMAATPGTSNHGFGVAVDLDVPGYDSTEYKWLANNASKYNFVNPAWAQKDGSKPEPWHWEWTKKSTVLS